MHHLLARLILDRLQLLQCHKAARLELLRGQLGTAQQIGIDAQGGGQVLGQHGAAVVGVQLGDPFGPFHAQFIEVFHELAAVARAAASQAQLVGERGQAGPLGRIVDAPGRSKKGEGHRFERHHRLGQQDQAIVVRVREDTLRHRHLGGLKGCDAIQLTRRCCFLRSSFYRGTGYEQAILEAARMRVEERSGKTSPSSVLAGVIQNCILSSSPKGRD